jgi:manganese/iron transport system permease protein
MMQVGAVIGVISSITGMYISYYLNVPSGAAIVLVVSVLFLLALFFSPSQGILTRPEMAHRSARLFSQLKSQKTK